MTLYCDWCRSGKASDIHIHHHDLEHGIPPTTDNQPFSRLCYEVLQAGLSWDIILKRRDGLHAVWLDFDVETIAGLSDSELAVIDAAGASGMVDRVVAALPRNPVGKVARGEVKSLIYPAPQ